MCHRENGVYVIRSYIYIIYYFIVLLLLRIFGTYPIARECSCAVTGNAGVRLTISYCREIPMNRHSVCHNLKSKSKPEIGMDKFVFISSNRIILQTMSVWDLAFVYENQVLRV